MADNYQIEKAERSIVHRRAVVCKGNHFASERLMYSFHRQSGMGIRRPTVYVRINKLDARRVIVQCPITGECFAVKNLLPLDQKYSYLELSMGANALRLALGEHRELYDQILQVFKVPLFAYQWLQAPHELLNGSPPSTLLATDPQGLMQLIKDV
ncbi:hypothetical protein GCM10011369_18960 [Neiella marina]|uniref:Uncharacterized protein n=2 Tax=Neiella marina TaxID=508461 RepID=A0A8J2U574_9GAMM|nr:hypothetical protein GCM10011369_18960 [Neiella marina]